MIDTREKAPAPYDDCCEREPDGVHAPGCPWVADTVDWLNRHNADPDNEPA